MERFYNIAGLDICISGKEEEMYIEERNLKHFRTDCVKSPYIMDFQIVDKLSEPRGEKIYTVPSRYIYVDKNVQIRYNGVMNNGMSGAYLRIEKENRDIHVEVLRSHVNERIPSKVVLECMGIEQLAVEAGGFVLHASCVEKDGKAIVFTAPSGIGKSTQAELWKQFRKAQIINGDRIIIKENCGVYEACGLPFSGSSTYCENRVLPITAIVYLEKDVKTKITNITGYQAFRSLFEGCTIPVWDTKSTDWIMGMLQRLIETVPIYRLECLPDESAVNILEAELLKG